MNYRQRFFNKKKDFLTIAEIIKITNSKILNDNFLSYKIFDIATLEGGNIGQISFLNSGKYFQKFQESEVEFCFVEENILQKNITNKTILLINKNPYFAYSQIAKEFYEEKIPDFSGQKNHKIGQNSKIDNSSYIGNNVEIGKNCVIYPNCAIMDGCIIGDNVVVKSNSVLEFCKIGNNCIIHNGVKIGQDGFGFAHNNGVNHKIIQLGIVEIGNDVEIGSNSCIDRGAIENTIIEDNVKIDNLVQIAHNVKIAKGSVIAGCTAIAGSTEIGQFVQIGGTSSINGHIKIGNFAKIAGMSGVVKDVADGQTVGGFPAIDIRDWHRINIRLKSLIKS